eukprot:GHVP01047649.1.p1 GENE.GHVP01047649.1~~GHVP01047649.1.p1  ORF type:complete len:382 (+),score=54.75 GHVP01047649.1:568-1713(+)
MSVTNDIPLGLVQAMIIVDSNSYVFPLSDNAEHPKFLLPINNTPLIHYPLYWLLANNIYEVYIFVDDAQKQRLKASIKVFEQDEKTTQLSINVLEYEDLSSFTDKLKIVADKCRHLLMNIPDDFVSNYSPSSMLKEQIKNNNSITIVFQKLKNQSGMLVGFSNEDEVVMLEENLDNSIKPKYCVLKNQRNIVLDRTLSETKIVVLSKNIIDYVIKNEIYADNINDLINILIEYKNSGELSEEKYPNSPYSCDVSDEVFSKLPNIRRKELDCKLCVAHILPDDTLYRATRNSKNYRNMNLEWQKEKDGNILGKNVSIGTGTIIKNSILLDDTVIGNNVKLNRVILSFKGVIEDDCKLTSCEIGPECIVKKGTDSSDECFHDH